MMVHIRPGQVFSPFVGGAQGIPRIRSVESMIRLALWRQHLKHNSYGRTWCITCFYRNVHKHTDWSFIFMRDYYNQLIFSRVVQV